MPHYRFTYSDLGGETIVVEEDFSGNRFDCDSEAHRVTKELTDDPGVTVEVLVGDTYVLL